MRYPARRALVADVVAQGRADVAPLRGVAGSSDLARVRGASRGRGGASLGRSVAHTVMKVRPPSGGAWCARHFTRTRV